MIRINSLKIIENEHLYGPGKRLLIFLQGCSLHCVGCINKELWPFVGGETVESKEILDICVKERLEGITLHGGEPLDQSEGLVELVELLKKEKKTIILFTGYAKKELNKTQIKIWDNSDIVVAGRFIKDKVNVNLQFRGSTNQKVYTHKGPYKNYKVNDGFTTAIVTINDNGTMEVNGFLTDDIKRLTGIK